MIEEPILDVAHLGHLELLTPKPEESLRFFVDVMGMTESGRKGDSVSSAPGMITSNIRFSLPPRRPLGSDMPHFVHVARRPCNAASPRLKNPGSVSAGSTTPSATVQPFHSATPMAMRSSFITRRNGIRRRKLCGLP